MFTPTALSRFDSKKSSPDVPARIMRLQRTVAGAAYDQVNGGWCAVADAARTVCAPRARPGAPSPARPAARAGRGHRIDRTVTPGRSSARPRPRPGECRP